jgi:hypothetical protein
MGSHDPLGLDVDKCIEKATNVMKRVGKMLNIEVPEEQPKQEEIEKTEEVKQPEIPVQPIPEVKVEVPKQEEISPFLSQQAENVEPQTSVEESNVKKVLPEADSFWGKQDLNEIEEDTESFPNLATSNDDFFANNMDNFEFPNLDEFK